MLSDQSKRQYHSVIPHSKPCLTTEDGKAIDAVLRSGMIAEGNLVKDLENAVGQYLGLLGGVATSSGTNALFFALTALGTGVGDEVIIPTYVCRSVWDGVIATGATPVLCDVGDDWCASAETIKPQVTARTKAIIVVPIFGIASDVIPICEMGVPVIEDCCQAFGAIHGDKMVGTFGELCFLSFHATKLLTTGEGGMVLTGDPGLLDRLRDLKQGKNGNLAVRYRQPMADLQAALGLSQLARYGSFLRRRQSIADFYFNELKDLPVRLPRAIRDRSIFFRFPLRVQGDFESLRRLFDVEGVQVRRGVDSLLHRRDGMNPEGFAGAEKCFSESLSIPLYPALSDEDCERVVDSCRYILAKQVIGGPREG